MRDKDSVRTHRIQIVPRKLDGGAAMASVMVVPVLLRHESRHSEAYQRHDGSGGRADCLRRRIAGLAGKQVFDEGIYGGYGQSYPYGKCIERACICIIPLPDLIRRLVEVYHNGYPGHEEQKESEPCPPLVAGELEEQAYETEQKRKHVIMILPLVVLQIVGSVGLVAETGLVYESYAAFPVSRENLSRRRAVDIILPSGKIPHEVSPVHPVQLIVQEEIEIRAESGLLVFRPRYRGAFPVHV